MESYGSINEGDNKLTKEQERMQRNLRYHFMNPKEKWQAKGTLPIKLMIIIIKLIILTVQLILFSNNNSNEIGFLEGSKTAFKHLFLKTWQSSYETLPYPPSSGAFAIYKIEDFYLFSNSAMKNYYGLESKAIGPYGYADKNKPKMTLTVISYKIKSINPSNSTYSFSKTLETKSIELNPIYNSSGHFYDVKAYFKEKNFSIDFRGMLLAKIEFSLRTIQLKSYEMDQTPDCFQFNVIIKFDNGKHNGQVLVDLDTELHELECNKSGDTELYENFVNRFLISIDSLSLIFSILSLFLCTRSLIRLYRFWRKAKSFFINEMDIDITDKRKHFISVSYILIFCGDVLIIIGTLMKIDRYMIEPTKGVASFGDCTYFLGIGVFLSYVTLLRYFSFYPKSSILVNTIRAAGAPLIRFSLCSIILYLAFSLLGWTILGPYHLKFRTFVNSLACLFSLMNGDDMYVTLSIIGQNNLFIFMFSQFFVYVFCFLFIFVVLNLVLTIIIEAYNEVQKQDLSTTNNDVFWRFINSCPESSKSPLYRSDLIYENSVRQANFSKFSRKFVDTLCCCIGKGGHTVEIKDDSESQSHESLNEDFFRSLDQLNDLNHLVCTRMNNPKQNYKSLVQNRKRSVNFGEIPIRHHSRGGDLACSL